MNLDHIITRLEQIITAVEADLTRRTEHDAPFDAELARDANGRHLLLDAYTALAVAQTTRDQGIIIEQSLTAEQRQRILDRERG